MTRHVLFIQGAGSGAYNEDQRLAESLRASLGTDFEVRYPAMPNEDDAHYAQWRQRIEHELATMAGTVIVAGHSAGGHLSACLLATEAHVPAAYAISGLFELAPLISTSLNEKLRLDSAEAEALSPILWPAPEGKSLDAIVGGNESSEYLRQSASIIAAWGEEGVETRYEEAEGANHFTVIDPLADPTSAMCERLKQLVARA